MEASIVFGLVDVGAGISMESCCLTMKVPAREVLCVPGVSHADLLIVRVDRP